MPYFTTNYDYFGVNQPLTCTLDTETDLTGATLQIRITNKTTEAQTEYSATQVGSTQVITAEIPGGVLSAGRWFIQALVTFSGDTYPTPGKPILITVSA